jgi:membrane-bound lytic murein transglycosylase B
MPCSWLKFGEDGDNDGRVDLFADFNDIIMSVANYLDQNGWERSPSAAVWSYNHDRSYVAQVLSFARSLEEGRRRQLYARE